MLIHINKVKKPLTRAKLNNFCSKFFKLNFNSEYISVQLKFKDIDNQIYDIGKPCVVNITQKRSIQSYKIHVIDEWENFLILPNTGLINRVIFDYKIVNKFDILKSS